MSQTVTAVLIWLTVAIIALVIEAISLGLTSVWFTGGGLAAAIAAGLGAGVYLQIVIFIAVSVGLVLMLRPLAKKRIISGSEPTNLDSLIGRKEIVIEEIDNIEKTGRIRINDVEWRASSEDGSVINKGSLVEVVRIAGTKLIVRRIADLTGDV